MIILDLKISCLLWPEAVSDDDEVGGGVGGAVEQGREHVVQVKDIPGRKENIVNII